LVFTVIDFSVYYVQEEREGGDRILGTGIMGQKYEIILKYVVPTS